MVATACLMLYSAWSVMRSPSVLAPADLASAGNRPRRVRIGWLIGIGLAAGFLAGLLGIGGGLVMVPAFTLLLGMRVKEIVASSLVAVAMMSVSSLVGHIVAGHVDWAYALPLMVGVIPGARVGSKITVAASEATMRRIAGIGLFAIGTIYLVTELARRPLTAASHPTPVPGNNSCRSGCSATTSAGVAPQFSQCADGGASSRAGFRSKKPKGVSRNPVYSTGMTGQSSGRGMWVTPNVYQSTTSSPRRSSRSAAVARSLGQAGAPGVLVGEVPGRAALVGPIRRDPEVVAGEPGPATHRRLGWANSVGVDMVGTSL